MGWAGASLMGASVYGLVMIGSAGNTTAHVVALGVGFVLLILDSVKQK